MIALLVYGLIGCVCIAVAGTAVTLALAYLTASSLVLSPGDEDACPAGDAGQASNFSTP